MAKYATNASDAMLLINLIQVTESISWSVVPLAMPVVFLSYFFVTGPGFNIEVIWKGPSAGRLRPSSKCTSIFQRAQPSWEGKVRDDQIKDFVQYCTVFLSYLYLQDLVFTMKWSKRWATEGRLRSVCPTCSTRLGRKCERWPDLRLCSALHTAVFLTYLFVTL